MFSGEWLQVFDFQDTLDHHYRNKSSTHLMSHLNWHQSQNNAMTSKWWEQQGQEITWQGTWSHRSTQCEGQVHNQSMNGLIERVWPGSSAVVEGKQHSVIVNKHIVWRETCIPTTVNKENTMESSYISGTYACIISIKTNDDQWLTFIEYLKSFKGYQM